MIDTLRTKLSEMESAELFLQASNQGRLSDEHRHIRPAKESENAGVPNSQDDIDASGLELPPQEIHATKAGSDAMVAAASAQYQTARPPLFKERIQKLEPHGLERLLEPIEQVIGQQMDRHGSESWLTNSNRPSSRGSTSDDIPITTVSCTCDRVLDAVEWRLPMRKRADSLLTLYFAEVHRSSPILHQRTFSRQYERLWLSQSSTSLTKPTHCVGLCKQKCQGRLFPSTLNVVFALGSLYDSGSPERNAAQADSFFQLARGIDLLDILQSEVALEPMQFGLLLATYLQSTERFSECWNIVVLTTRVAQSIGLHFSDSEVGKRGFVAPVATQLDREMRSRVWYSCIVLQGYVRTFRDRHLLSLTHPYRNPSPSC